VQQLLATIDKEAKAGDRGATRDAAMVRLMYCAAMRRSEVVGLRFPDDIELDHPEGAVVRPKRKGRRERQLLLVSDRAAAAIRRWLKVRGEQDGPLFHRLDSGVGAGAIPNLSGESVRRILDVWANRAGVKSRVRPHGLRHSAATEVARHGSLDELMSLGGWKSFSAAQAYLDLRLEQRRRALKLVDA
jgi:integrase/recombinase XerD